MRGALAADWEEFLAATCHLNRLTQNEHLQRAFAHFDRDGSGTITADEIMEALKGQGVSQEEATELLAEWDANSDGVIRCAAGSAAAGAMSGRCSTENPCTGFEAYCIKTNEIQSTEGGRLCASL